MHHLEKQRPFSQSRIWQLQRDYFSGAGIDAWRSGQVPHYVTGDPVRSQKNNPRSSPRVAFNFN